MDGHDCTRQAVPYARERWNEIVPGLFMGSHTFVDPTNPLRRLRVQVGREFDLVVSLCVGVCARSQFGPPRDVEHLLLDIEDDELSDVEYAAAEGLAHKHIRPAVNAGEKVLVRCHAGFNRSGLVVAMTLAQMGFDMDDAIDLIREKRSPNALSNHFFVAYLRGF